MKTPHLLLICSLTISFSCFGQQHEINLDNLIQETQKTNGEADDMRIIWWIPTEFWVASFQQEKSMSQEQKDEFINLLKPYSLFAVVDGKIGPFGGVTYRPVEEIEKSISLIGNNNTEYFPIKSEKLGPDLQNVLATFKPIFKNMMGQLGENMNIFVFSDQTKKGKRISDPYFKGGLTFMLGETEYQWRTPLGSLIPEKICPKDDEKLNGAWDYCPWHGEKLEEAK